jgi:glycosyltransferase involved in cell wall biosynthesis
MNDKGTFPTAIEFGGPQFAAYTGVGSAYRVWVPFGDSPVRHGIVGGFAHSTPTEWNASPESLSLVIPAYNEGERLEKSLLQYLPVLEALGVPYEVIVIADGSDHTPEVAQKYRSRGVRCYTYSEKLGRGGAILEGFRRAKFEVIAFADADGSVPGSDFKQMARLALGGMPAVVASRRLEPKMVAVPEPPLRRSIGFVWATLVKLVLGVQLEDSQCGLKVFSRSVVRDVILRRLTVTNRTFEVAMMFHVARAGVPVCEFPVRYVHDFDSRMPIVKAVPVMFLTLMGVALANMLEVRGMRPPRFIVGLNSTFASV